MLGFTLPTSAKLHRLSLIEGTGSLLSSNRLVLRLTDKMRYVQAVSPQTFLSVENTNVVGGINCFLSRIKLGGRSLYK